MAAHVDWVGTIRPAPPIEEFGKGPTQEPLARAKSLEGLLAQAEGLMRNFYAEADPEDTWHPIVIAACRNGEVAQILQADHFPDDEWATMLRDLFREAGVVRYACAMEGWVAAPGVIHTAGTDRREAASDGFIDPGAPPAENPARRDVAVVFAVEHPDRVEARVLEIHRDADGTVGDVSDVTASFGAPGSSVAAAFGLLARIIQETSTGA